MKQRNRTSARRRTGAFTLLELLLVVVLIVMLTSAMVFNFSNLLRGSELEEGTNRIETLMRYARAQAANSGRKVQLVFNSESTNTTAASTGEVRATWEPDPLGQPGCFADLFEAQWHVQEINELVQVESVKLLDASAACPPTASSEEDGEVVEEMYADMPAKPMSPITFYPDGSSDSAEIIVAPKSSEEEQRMAVRLVGITGSISHQLVSADLEESLWDSGLPERPTAPRRDALPRDVGVERDTSSTSSSTTPSTRSATSASRPVPAVPRAPVGGTNTVGAIE